MKDNWIIYIVIFFFVIRLFTSASKKQAAAAKASESDTLKKAIADQARKNRKRESDNNIRIAAEAVRERTDAASRARRITRGTEDFEAAYKSDDYQDVQRKQPATPDYTDQFGSATGVTEGSYKETAEEREVYDAVAQVPKNLLPAMTTETYRQFIIAKEIFDKPKSMR
jgi:hypothetical protein